MTLRDALERARALAILRRPNIADEVLDLLEQLHGAGVGAGKLFPAGPLGIPYVNAPLGPFRAATFVPTEDVPAWLDTGAICVGMGGELVGSGGVDPGVRDLLASTP